MTFGVLMLVLALSPGATSAEIPAAPPKLEVVPGLGLVSPAPAGSPYRSRVDYRIHKNDGTVERSLTCPLVAFDEVIYTNLSGTALALPVNEVDLPISRKSWSVSRQWDLLDRHAWLGKAWPRMDHVGTNGVAGRIMPAKGWQLIVLYRSYCLPCHAQLSAMMQWLREHDAKRALTTTAVCVDCTHAQLLAIVRDRKIQVMPGWTNARFATEPPWLKAALEGGIAKMAFLVDTSGVIRHAYITNREGDYYPNVLEELVTSIVTPRTTP